MYAFFMVLLVIAGFLGVAGIVMLLVDPATQGAYTVSYGQSLAITALVGILFSSSGSWKE